MLEHGTYHFAAPTRIRCGISSFDVRKGSSFEVVRTDHRNRKQLVRFSERDTEWYSDSQVARWAGLYEEATHDPA